MADTTPAELLAMIKGLQSQVSGLKVRLGTAETDIAKFQRAAEAATTDINDEQTINLRRRRRK